MATKSTTAGSKRKGPVSTTKAGPITKRARLESRQSKHPKKKNESPPKGFSKESSGKLSVADADEFSGLDDSSEDDGGVPVGNSDSDAESELEHTTPMSRAQKDLAKDRTLSHSTDGKQSVKSKGQSQSRSQEQGQTSRESHAKQKQLAQERKAAKPLADQVHRTKKIWERLRIKSKVPPEERRELVAELFSLISGRIRDFVLKHDAVRAVQTALKYGTREQRRQVARELCGSFALLAESRYAKFLLGKMMTLGDDEIKNMVIPEFYGKVRRLINHPEASWIVDDIYRVAATKKQKAIILREWYGPEFALKEMNKGAATAADGTTETAATTSDLATILAHEPSKHGPIMRHLRDMINALIQKRMTGFTSLHDAMLQYFLNLRPDSEEVGEFGELIRGDETGDLLKNMAFTRSGARLICLLLARGDAKERKLLLRTFKDTWALMSGDAHAHVVILTAYTVIDDTKLTAKAIFPELLGGDKPDTTSNVVAAANNPHARTALLYLLEGPSRALFPDSRGWDLEVLREVESEMARTSKKDAATRRAELVAALSPHLIGAVASGASDLVTSSFGCQLITDVLLTCVGDKSPAVAAVATVAAVADGNPTTRDGGNGNDENDGAAEVGDAADKLADKFTVNLLSSQRPHISQTPFGGRMLKMLVAGGHFDRAAGCVRKVEPPLLFADALWPHIKQDTVQWATGPSSFVVLNLFDSDLSEENKAELRKFLGRKEAREALRRAAEAPSEGSVPLGKEAGGEESNGGGQVEKGKKDGKGKNGKVSKSAKDGEKRKAGNLGSRLLLDKLKKKA